MAAAVACAALTRCPWCRGRFRPARPRQRYCSDRCCKRASQARRIAELRRPCAAGCGALVRGDRGSSGRCHACAQKARRAAEGSATSARRGALSDGRLPPPPPWPTPHPPGSPDKLLTMELRAACGYAVFHPNDSRASGDS